MDDTMNQNNPSGVPTSDSNQVEPSGTTDTPPSGAPASETGVPSETPGAPATETPPPSGDTPSEENTGTV